MHMADLSPGAHEITLEAGKGDPIGRARTTIRIVELE